MKELHLMNQPMLLLLLMLYFLSVKPIPAAAQPEYEFNIDITTGISAPPIGIINNTPTKNDINTIDQNIFDD